MDSGYPKAISKGFDGIPNRVDAAFVWSGNGKIYFFKGSKYYRFDPDDRYVLGMYLSTKSKLLKLFKPC